MTEIKQADSINSKTMKFIIAAVVGAIVAAILVAGFIFNKSTSDAAVSEQDATNQNQVESARVIDTLNQILLTDSEAEPTVARVEDPEILRQANQDFYKNAAKGDYLVLFPQRAVLFREAEQLIVNVAPIINSEQLRGASAGIENLPVVE